MTLHTDGSFEYIPAGNLIELDTFTYRVTDGVDYAQPVTVFIEITPVNDPPAAMPDAFTTTKNVTLTESTGVLANDYDLDNLTLTAQLVTGPEHGTLTFAADGTFTFTPDTGYVGADSFTYLVSDGSLTDETTVSLTVEDLPPEVPTKAYTAQKNSPLTVPVAEGLLEGVTDPDDPGVSFYALLTTAPQHGTASVNPDGSFTYTPSSNYTGPDTFGVEIGHAGGGGAVAVIVVGLNVLQPNQAPVAANDEFLLDEDTVRTGNVLANDDDPDTSSPLTASLVSGVSNGTLTFSADGTFLYTPNLNWFGTDIFAYTILDDGQPTVEDLPPESLPVGFTASDFTTVVVIGGPLGSNTATVSLIVAPINDLPVTTDISFGIDEDTQLLEPGGMFIGVTDPDNDPSELTPIIVTPPAFGIIVITPGGSIVYTPDPGFSGSVNFGFIITDPSGPSEPATGTIIVEPVNDPPVAVDDAFTLDEDALYFSGDVAANDSDPDGPSLTFSLLSGVSNGNLILNSSGGFNYTPNSNYFGTDSFTYQLSDGEFTATATVTLTITAVNDAPIATDDSFAGDEDTDLSGSLLGNDFDPDEDPLANVTLQTSPAHGTLLFDSSGSFTYTPNPNYFGDDSFTYYVYDSTSAQSNPATVYLTINPINDPPTAQDQSHTLDEDTTFSIDASNGLILGASDPENDPLTISIIDQPLHGQLVADFGGGFTYSPDENYFGADSFFFAVSDGDLVATATATLNINSVNDVPVASDDTFILDEDSQDFSGHVISNDVDVDGPDGLTASLVSNVSHGALNLNSDGTFTYIPDANYFGSDSFTYQAFDGVDLSSTATVYLTINNMLPEVSIDNAVATEGDALTFTVTLSETDTSDITVSFEIVAGSATIDEDYIDEIGTITIPAGDLTATITVLTLADHFYDEGTETLSVKLFSVIGGQFGTSTGVGEIEDNVPHEDPLIVIGDASAPEPESSEEAFLEFDVEYSAGDSSTTSSFYVQLEDGSGDGPPAELGADYAGSIEVVDTTTGSLLGVIGSGGEISMTGPTQFLRLRVPVLSDSDGTEPDELLTIRLLPVDTAQSLNPDSRLAGTGVILTSLASESGPPSISVTVSTDLAEVEEGYSVVVTFTLVNAPAFADPLEYITINVDLSGTAQPGYGYGKDYTPLPSRINFITQEQQLDSSTGTMRRVVESSKSFTIKTKYDRILEDYREHFTVDVTKISTKFDEERHVVGLAGVNATVAIVDGGRFSISFDKDEVFEPEPADGIAKVFTATIYRTGLTADIDLAQVTHGGDARLSNFGNFDDYEITSTTGAGITRIIDRVPGESPKVFITFGGFRKSISIDYRVIADNIVEGSESVVAALLERPNSNGPSLVIDTASDSIAITDDSTDSEILEGDDLLERIRTITENWRDGMKDVIDDWGDVMQDAITAMWAAIIGAGAGDGGTGDALGLIGDMYGKRPKADVRIELGLKLAGWALSQVPTGQPSLTAVRDKVTEEERDAKKNIDDTFSPLQTKRLDLKTRWDAAKAGGNTETIASVLAEIRAMKTEVEDLPTEFDHLRISPSGARYAIAKRICDANNWTLFMGLDGYESNDIASPWWWNGNDVAELLNGF